MRTTCEDYQGSYHVRMLEVSRECDRMFVEYEPQQVDTAAVVPGDTPDQDQPSQQECDEQTAKKSRNSQRRPSNGCFNCHTLDTPLWRRDGNGNSVCNKCGLYWMRHGMHRPEVVKSRTLGKRKKEAEDSVQKRVKIEPNEADQSPQDQHLQHFDNTPFFDQTPTDPPPAQPFPTTPLSTSTTASLFTNSDVTGSDMFMFGDYDTSTYSMTALLRDGIVFPFDNTFECDSDQLLHQRISALVGAVLPDLPQQSLDSIEGLETTASDHINQ